MQVWEESAPAPLLDQLTWPAGVIAEPASVSVTVAVQVAAELTRTGVSHSTVMEVDRAVPVIWVDAVPEACRWSPP